MNKPILTLLTVLLATVLFADDDISRPSRFSPIAPAKNIAVNTDPDPCDAYCLDYLLRQERIFSFLARYDGAEADARLSDEYHRLAVIYNLQMPTAKGERIAILLASESIGRYAINITNSVSAYLLEKNKPFEMQVFDSIDETQENLDRALKEIEAAGFSRAIAAVSTVGAQNLANMGATIELYMPLVNRGDIGYAPANFYFGAIDYLKQIEALSLYANKFRTAAVEENLNLSRKITGAADAILPIPPKHILLGSGRVDPKMFEKEKVTAGASILLNTRPEKTIVLLPFASSPAVGAASILSAQLNYNPLLLTVPQAEDVKNLYVASSIGDSIDVALRDINLLLRNYPAESDPRFSWTGYATTALAAMISQRNAGDYSLIVGLFGLEMRDNQLQYPVRVYQIRNSRFVLAPPPPETPITQVLPPLPGEENSVQTPATNDALDRIIDQTPQEEDF